jgi:DNA-binding CsgD family transcriptional regulator
VIDLAVQSRSNRTIAETLFLSEKTVESHLTNAYRKLGIRSRHELAAAIDDARAHR